LLEESIKMLEWTKVTFYCMERRKKC
jgi:hypothetical protein